MGDPYWIVDDAMIFKPQFNECLDNYIDIISNCRILIFSNNDDLHTSLKNNKADIINIYSYIKSSFNQSVDCMLNLNNLRELTFGYNFNQPLGNSLSNLVDLQELTLGNNFNKSLNNSLLDLHNLRKLIFGCYFNQPLNDTLSNLVNLRELTLGYYFNQPLDIPNMITKLKIYCNCQYIIDYLPSSVEELVLGYDFNLELNDLPSSIKKIIIKSPYYNKKLNNLPTGIETLEISSRYKVPIDAKYKNLNIVYLD